MLSLPTFSCFDADFYPPHFGNLSCTTSKKMRNPISLSKFCFIRFIVSHDILFTTTNIIKEYPLHYYKNDYKVFNFDLIISLTYDFERQQ